MHKNWQCWRGAWTSFEKAVCPNSRTCCQYGCWRWTRRRDKAGRWPGIWKPSARRTRGVSECAPARTPECSKARQTGGTRRLGRRRQGKEQVQGWERQRQEGQRKRKRQRRLEQLEPGEQRKRRREGEEGRGGDLMTPPCTTSSVLERASREESPNVQQCMSQLGDGPLLGSTSSVLDSRDGNNPEFAVGRPVPAVLPLGAGGAAPSTRQLSG